MVNLRVRRFDLWAWATYTTTHKVTMLLGSIPPRLDRQHERAWGVGFSEPQHLGGYRGAQLIYSIQSFSHLYPPLPPSPPLPHFPLPRMRLTAKYVRVHLTNIKCSRAFVTYATQDGVWTTSSHPSPPSQLGPGNVCTPRHNLPQAATRHLQLPSPILDFDSD